MMARSKPLIAEIEDVYRRRYRQFLRVAIAVLGDEATAHDAVMERVDDAGHVIGFSILGVSRYTKEKPLTAELDSK